MKKLAGSAAAKAFAVLLLFITLTSFLVGTVAAVVMASAGFYGAQGSPKTLIASLLDTRMNDMIEGCAIGYYTAVLETPEDRRDSEVYKNGVEEFKKQYEYSATNCAFSVYDTSTGECLYSNYTPSGVLVREVYCFTVTADGGVSFSYYGGIDSASDYYIEASIDEDLHANDSYKTLSGWVTEAYRLRHMAVAAAVCSFIMSVLLFVFIVYSAGRRREADAALRWIDKIPFDLSFAAAAVCVIFFAVLGMSLLESAASAALNFYDLDAVIIYTGGCILSFAASYLSLMSLIMTFAVRVRKGGWWKNTIIARLFGWIKYFINSLTVAWRTGVVLFGVLVVLFIGMWSDSMETLAFVCILLWLAGSAVAVISAANMYRLRKGARIIASGDLTYQIDTSRMLRDFREHAEDLNSIRSGMSAAIQESLKSERLKTELITNVSHDIKTPLTSIVNYVDLLKKEKLDNPTAAGYIEVLDRQSIRLKKLIEDLVEASRASTGNISVSRERTSLGILLAQAAGEYEERLTKAGLELVMSKPEEDVFISADGRLLWRVLDNLMNNVCKYALSGTRVYVTLESEEGLARITFKNISRDELNISADELMERFVRGDRSRSTEGSGLGLSIARSLTEIQGGKMELMLDGDLFKAILTFNRLAEGSESV